MKIAISAVVALAFVSSAPAQAVRTTLLVYSPHGPEILLAAKEAFEAEHPRVEVKWVFEGAHELYARLKREKSRPAADVWWGGPQSTFMLATEDGLLKPYKPTWTAATSSEFHDRKHHWYGDLLTPLTIFYSKITPNVTLPKDWDDMLDPAYQGRIAARYPLTSGTVRSLYLALVDRQIRKGKTLDQALDWMRSWEANIATYTPHSAHMMRLVGKGILPFGIWNAPEVKMRDTEGYNLDLVFPASGMPVLVDCIALIRKNKSHPAAQDFYEFVTSKKFAERLTRTPFNRIHVRQDLPATATPDYLRSKDYKVMQVDWQRIAKEGEVWMSRLVKEVLDSKKLMPGEGN